MRANESWVSWIYWPGKRLTIWSVNMSLHHWLRWLAFCLAWLWLGQTLQQPLPEPVAIAAFDDGYLIPRESALQANVADREAKTDANGEASRDASNPRRSWTRAAGLLR